MKLYVVACSEYFGQDSANPSAGVYLETFDRKEAVDACRRCNRTKRDSFSVYVFDLTPVRGIFNPKEEGE